MNEAPQTVMESGMGGGLQPRGTVVPPNGTPPTSDGTLAGKLKSKLMQSGSLSSGDLANFIAEDKSDKSEDKSAENAFDKTTVIAVDENNVGSDPIVQRAAEADSPLAVSPGTKKLSITPDDKEAFVSALISNDRFTRKFEFYGGRVTVTLRSRTVRESQGILAATRLGFESKQLVTNSDYTIHLRAMLMAAQVAELNGAEFPVLEEPVMPIQNADGTKTTPAWLPRVDYWMKQNENLAAILWQAIEEFELKYWSMVEDSRDSNFWNPATSTSA